MGRDGAARTGVVKGGAFLCQVVFLRFCGPQRRAWEADVKGARRDDDVNNSLWMWVKPRKTFFPLAGPRTTCACAGGPSRCAERALAENGAGPGGRCEDGEIVQQLKGQVCRGK